MSFEPTISGRTGPKVGQQGLSAAWGVCLDEERGRPYISQVIKEYFDDSHSERRNSMDKDLSSACARCQVAREEKICLVEGGRGPKFCPTLNRADAVREATVQYDKEEVREFARQASIQEAECYADRDKKPYARFPLKPRVQEICEFANKMGFKKLGIAFCVGLTSEAGVLTKILVNQGFEVVSVMCKVGRVPKERIGVKDREKINIGEFEPMCNSVAQAEVLNQEKTELNILLGLCVGHDCLFFKYADAYTTVLVAKDRVLGHNPVAALYTSGSYYSRMMKSGF
jgi:uncharacterized metal-binding protein